MSGEVASSKANTLGLRAGAPAAGTVTNENGTDSLQSMLHALDELADTHLPNVHRLGETLFDEMTLSLHCDDPRVRETLARLEAALASLQSFLDAHGLAGMPLEQADAPQNSKAVRERLRNTFEERARLQEATSMVAGILRSRKSKGAEGTST